MVSDYWVLKHPGINLPFYMEKSKDFPPYILLLGSLKVFLLVQQEKNNDHTSINLLITHLFQYSSE